MEPGRASVPVQMSSGRKIVSYSGESQPFVSDKSSTDWVRPTRGIRGNLLFSPLI